MLAAVFWLALVRQQSLTMATAKRNKAGTKTSIPQPYAARLRTLRHILRGRKADAVLITDPSEQFYLTGFTGEDGAVLLTARSLWLVTDGRFTEQAKRQAGWAKTKVRKGELPDLELDDDPGEVEGTGGEPTLGLFTKEDGTI